MLIACIKSHYGKVIGFFTSFLLWLSLGSNVFAQIATDSVQTKGGTTGALPNAGSTEITYALFIGGVILFVVGTLKLILSFRE